MAEGEQNLKFEGTPPTVEFKIPTENDLQELEREMQGLGTGETVHEIENILGELKDGFRESNEKQLWDSLKVQNYWTERIRNLRMRKNRRLQEIAKEKGLI